MFSVPVLIVLCNAEIGAQVAADKSLSGVTDAIQLYLREKSLACGAALAACCSPKMERKSATVKLIDYIRHRLFGSPWEQGAELGTVDKVFTMSGFDN